MSCSSLLLRFASAAVFFVTASMAQADDALQAEARRLFEQGNQQLDRGAYVEALASFEQAYARWQNPKILLNVATTLRQLGRLAQAGDRYEQYLNDPGADASKRDQARSAMEEIDKAVAHLTVSVNKQGAEARIDGAVVSIGGARPLRVEAGRHTLIVSASGHRTVVRDVALVAGERRTLELSLEAEAVTPVAKEPGSKEKPLPGAEPARQTEKDQLRPEASASGLGVVLRADIDGKLRGAVAAIGGSYGVARWADLQATALLGRDKGFEAGASFHFGQGIVKPLVFVGIPVFFADGARPGGHVAAGVRVDPWEQVGLLGQLGVAAFASAPDHYDRATFLPSVGAQGRF